MDDFFWGIIFGITFGILVAACLFGGIMRMTSNTPTDNYARGVCESQGHLFEKYDSQNNIICDGEIVKSSGYVFDKENKVWISKGVD